jgi:redox-sensitive bicupin YhaK (pirin superfamily)
MASDGTTSGPPAGERPPELLPGREADVGGVTVRRLLPRATRRTVGAWCFVDHAGPVDAAERSMQVGPHPHTGLHTVTWMLDGELVHRDSLGSEQLLRAGQVNLMTAGHGVVHAEQAPPRASGAQQLVQLWVAQPERTRHGEPAFEHHAEPPVLETAALTATLLVGRLGEAVSPARADTPIVGADVVVRAPTALPLESAFEHAVLAIEHPVLVEGTVVEPGTLAYLAPGADEVGVAPAAGSRQGRLVLVGGQPFEERLAMFWNFVARSRDELEEMAADWASGDPRFGAVGGGLPRVPVPSMGPRSR